MFKIIGVVNFVMEGIDEISIVCKIFDKLKVGDSIMCIYKKSKIVSCKIEKIYGFKEKEHIETVEGCVYRVVIKTDNFDKAIKLLKYGDSLFAKVDEIPVFKDLLLPDFEKAQGFEEQYYKMFINYRNHTDSKEVEKINIVINLLKDYGYEFKFNENKDFVVNIESYLLQKLQKSQSDFNTILLYDINRQFYIRGRIGSRNDNVINNLEILFPEKCSFTNDDTNYNMIRLFQKINNIIKPSWSFVCSNVNDRKFAYKKDGSLPTALHYINYYSSSLREKINRFYDIHLDEYVILRTFPFNEFSIRDRKIQEKLYYKYAMDKMTEDLQRTYFKSEKELLFYCDIL